LPKIQYTKSIIPIPNLSILQAANHTKAQYWLLRTPCSKDTINKLRKRKPDLNQSTDQLGDPLTTRPILTGWEFTSEPYPSWQFGFMDNLDCQFGNSPDWTQTRTRSDGLEPLLTQTMVGHVARVIWGCDWLQTVINEVLAALIGKTDSETLPAPSWKCASTACQWFLPFHYGQLQRDEAIMVDIHHFDCICTLKGLPIVSCSSVNEISCYSPGGCGGNIP